MKKRKYILIPIVLVVIVLAYLKLNSPSNDPICTFDSNKAPVSGIIFTSISEKQDKQIREKAEINKVIKYLNSIDFKKISVEKLKEKDDFSLALLRGQKWPATYLRFNEDYITMLGPNPTYFKSSKEIISELAKLYGK